MFRDKNNNVIIDYSGAPGICGDPGDHGSNGMNGSIHPDTLNGKKGKDGGVGKRGNNAQDILLTLMANERQKAVAVETKLQKLYFPLSNPTNYIITKANGGNGGNGGAGGRGGDGGRGNDGDNAGHYRVGGDGTNGGNGGNGGYGGKGGRGGNAGNLEVKVTSNDTDLLMLLIPPELKGGHGGEGGAGGKGGDGGFAGRGGSSFAWTETRQFDDSVETIDHFMPSGRDGRCGDAGQSRDKADNGDNGADGLFTIKVDDKLTYTGVYNLSISSYELFRSMDSVYEPGETLCLSNVTFKNTGFMPTPTHQNVVVSLESNHWIEFQPQHSLSLTGPLLPTESKKLDSALQFTINKNPVLPSIDSLFSQTAVLKFKAIMSRVDKLFANISQVTHQIAIRYPVEISTAYMPPSVSRDEEVPFIIKIRNISSCDVGSHATPSRPVEIDFSAMHNIDGSLVMCYDEEGRLLQSLENPLKRAPVILYKNSEAYFTGTLKFSPVAPTYAPLHFSFSLHLGKYNSLFEKENLQIRTIQTQLADNFQFDPAANILLVTNNQTDKKTIKHWESISQRLGTKLNIWNTSLYSGVSYTQKRLDQGSFIEQMKNKVVVILNNEMRVGNLMTRSTDCLDAMEILSAAKHANVATYVIGPDFNLNKAITPLASEEKFRQHPIRERFAFWHRPEPTHLFAHALDIHKRLKKENPNNRYIPVCKFRPEKSQTNCYSLMPTWELGTIELRESLDKSHSHVAFRQAEDNIAMREAKDADLFNIIMLSPIQIKLKYLEESEDKSVIVLAKQAILADLVNEVVVYAADKWNGSFTREKLKTSLANLNDLARYPFNNPSLICDVLLQYEYFTSRIPNNYDLYLFPFFCRRTLLKNICHEIIGEKLKAFFPNKKFENERITLRTQWDGVALDKLSEQWSFPFKDIVTFDNQVPSSDAVLEEKLPAYKPKKSSFIERAHFFATPAARKESLEKYRSKAVFEFK